MVPSKRGTKGKASTLLEQRIRDTVRHYTRLIVRQLYYILVSRFGYSRTRRWYKTFDYHLTKMRRLNSVLNAKFVDHTRQFIAAPVAYHEVELWVEKDAIRNFLEDLAMKYRLSIQVLRGFASLSMYRQALERAAKRNVRKILYVGDFDPSGLLIDKVAEREMRITIIRVALTWEQIKRLRPPSIPVNRRDSRAKEYVAKYGNRCWEVEALRPRTFHRIVEEELKKHVPSEYLLEANAIEQAAKTTRPLAARVARAMETEALRLRKEGKSEEEIVTILASKYGIQLRKRKPGKAEASGKG